MNPLRSAMIALLLPLLGAAALGQDQAAPKLFVRFQKVNTYQMMDTTGGGQVRSTDMQAVTVHYPTDSMCLLVYGDGSYYYEKMSERTIGKPKIQAVKGTLTPADLQQLQSITAEAAFKEISSPPVPSQPDDATYLKEGEVVTISVARANANQQFNLVTRRYASKTTMSGMDTLASNWSGIDKKLKPFLAWVKNVEKGSKPAQVSATGCPAAMSVQ